MRLLKTCFAAAGLAALLLAGAPASAEKVQIDPLANGVSQAAAWPMLQNASGSGQAVYLAGGSYTFSIAGTFNGATVSLVQAVNGATSTIAAFTGAGSGTYTIPAGATVVAVVSGGAPSGLYATLALNAASAGTGGGPVTAAAGSFADGYSATMGALADAACGSDTGACSEQALLKRVAQDLTTLNSTAGSLFKNGQTIGNTVFGASQSGNWTVTDQGSAASPFTQGTGAAGANSQNVFIGGAYSGITFNANLQLGGTALTSVTTTTTTAPANNIPVADLGNVPWIDSTTALGASSAFTGTVRTTPIWAKYFNATFFADQASASAGAEIDCSPDGGTTWRPMATATLSASVNVPLSLFVSCSTYRVKLTNSTTAEGALLITSSFTGG